MTPALRRVLLAILLLTSAFTGGWAYFAPQHWYRTFPGLGLTWLPPLGAYNEHFAKDIGAMYLALTVLAAIAIAWVRRDTLVRTTGAVALTSNVLHFVYHVTHLHVYDGLDKILVVTTLAILVVAAGTLLITSPQTMQAADSGHEARIPGAG